MNEFSLTSSLPTSSADRQTATFAPFLGRRRQRRAPMPVSAPVINTTWGAHLMILCWAAGNPTTFVRVTASSRDDHRQRRSISIIERR